MDIPTRSPRRIETSEERGARLEEESRKALDRALAEQDAMDAMVRRSIERQTASRPCAVCAPKGVARLRLPAAEALARTSL